MTFSETAEEDPYLTGASKCEYSGGWYQGRCSCPSHRRDRDYGYEKHTEPESNTFYHFPRSDSYEILQIEPPLEYEKVRRAYRKLSLQFHPDKGGSAEEFIKIKNAYDDLMLVI
jgi:hypothetical protein